MEDTRTETRDGIDNAMNICDLNIKRHVRFSWVCVALGGAILVFILLVFGEYSKRSLNLIDRERIALMEKVVESRHYLSDRRSDGYSKFNSLDAEIEMKKYIIDNLSGDEKLREGKLIESLKSELNKKKSELAQKLIPLEKQLQEDIENFKYYNPGYLISNELLIGFVSLFVVILSVFTALFRFHLKEIAKHESNKVGFSRVRIAYSLSSGEELEKQLTATLIANAFAISEGNSTVQYSKEIESPLPGHLASDIATKVVNRVMEQIDIVLKPKRNS